MGLTICIKGLDDRQTYNCGYLTFGIFRQHIARMIGTEFGERYAKLYGPSKDLTDDDWKYLEDNCPEAIGPFLFYSDCDGKLTPKECRAIHGWLKDKKLDMEGHNYVVMEPYNMLEHWLNMFKYCSEHRVNMYFT